MVPATALYLGLAQPIVAALLQRGAFDASDTARVSDTLTAFAVGLPAFSVYLYSLRAFYSMQDTRTPFLINCLENALNIVGALDTQYEGSVEVDGKQLRELDDVAISSYRNQNIGFIFQSFYLLEHMTCLENVALPSLFARDDRVLARPAALERAREVLAQVELLPIPLDADEVVRVGPLVLDPAAVRLVDVATDALCELRVGGLDARSANDSSLPVPERLLGRRA